MIFDMPASHEGCGFTKTWTNRSAPGGMQGMQLQGLMEFKSDKAAENYAIFAKT